MFKAAIPGIAAFFWRRVIPIVTEAADDRIDEDPMCRFSEISPG